MAKYAAARILVWVVRLSLAFDVSRVAGKQFSVDYSADMASSTKAAHVSSSTVESACSSRVEIFGYPCEEHTVTTKDGYILSLQRIPNGRSGSSSGTHKTPVLLQHGLFMDGITWLLNSPDESLGYILADNGYDVWLANSRGTVYSQGHVTLSANDSTYWDWTWDELAAYDLPANLEYVYQQTGSQRVNYVGHSLGTLIGFAGFSQQSLLDMVGSVAMLSPIAFMDQVSSAIVRASVELHLAEAFYERGIVEFDPRSEDAMELLKILCKQPGVDCFNMMSSFTGPNCCLNSSAIEVFLAHEPQPTSTKNLIHLAQMIRRGTVTMYDYGDDSENMSHYGQVSPPAYNISNIPDDLPLFLSHGGQDALSDVKDVRRLINTLDSHKGDKLAIEFRPNYAHADFVMAVNARQLVYDPLMAFFRLQ